MIATDLLTKALKVKGCMKKKLHSAWPSACTFILRVRGKNKCYLSFSVLEG